MIYCGDCLDILPALAFASVQTVVTSPPFWGIAEYGGTLGREAAPEEYVEHLVEIFSKVRRLLRDDGTLWLNLGDSRESTVVGMPYRVAFALEADGWNLEREVILDYRRGELDRLFLLVAGNAALYQASGVTRDRVWTHKPTAGEGGFEPMPVQFAARCIVSSTRAHDFVLDPFAGSGSTLVAAAELGRRYLGIETNPDDVQLAEQRLAKI